MQVNAKTLQEKIEELMRQPHLSIKEEYTLRAFFELCKRLQKEDARNCHCDYTVNENRRECLYCGKLL